MKKFFTFLATMVMANFYVNAANGATIPSKCTIEGNEFYELYTVEDLIWFSNEVNSESESNNSLNAILRNDIDLQDKWNPITVFTGIFDGNDYSIKADSLFVMTNRGTIKSLNYELIPTGWNRLVSDNWGTISNCAITCSASCNMVFNNTMGGTITNSYIIKSSPEKFNFCGEYSYDPIKNCAIITIADSDITIDTVKTGNSSFEGEIRVAGIVRFGTWKNWADNNYTAFKLRNLETMSYANINDSCDANHYIVFQENSKDDIKKIGKNVILTDQSGKFSASKIQIVDSLYFDTRFFSGYKGMKIDTLIYERILGSDLATFFFPFKVAKNDVNGEVYQLADFVNNTVTFKKVEEDSLEACTPYVLKGEKGTQLLKELHNITISPDIIDMSESIVTVAENNSNFSFRGYFTAVLGYDDDNNNDYNLYAFMNDQLCQLDTVEIRPLKALFQYNIPPLVQPSSRRVIGVSFDDNTTGVMMIENNKLTSSLVNVYDIYGRVVRENVDSFSCLENLAAGIYIVNGEKFIVKEK